MTHIGRSQGNREPSAAARNSLIQNYKIRTFFWSELDWPKERAKKDYFCRAALAVCQEIIAPTSIGHKTCPMLAKPDHWASEKMAQLFKTTLTGSAPARQK